MKPERGCTNGTDVCSQGVAVLTHQAPKIILPTLLFLSSSKTGFLGLGEGDGNNVASRGISGSTETIPKIKMVTCSYCSLEMTVLGLQFDKIIFKE